MIDTTLDTILLSVNPIAAPQNPAIFAPWSVSVSPNGATAYLADTGNRGIARVNLPAGTLAGFTTAPTNLTPFYARISPDGTRLAVSCTSSAGNYQLVVYNASTMAQIGSALDLGYTGSPLLPATWENTGSSALWIGRHGLNSIRRVQVTGATVSYDSNPATTLTMPKVEWTAISPSSGATLFAVGSSTAMNEDRFAYFDMTTGVRFDGQRSGPAMRGVALSSDVFIYIAQPNPAVLLVLPGGTMHCQADPADALRTLEYCQVKVYGGT